MLYRITPLPYNIFILLDKFAPQNSKTLKKPPDKLLHSVHNDKPVL